MTAMNIVAHSHPFVVGVDTHAGNHVYALVAAATGALLETRAFPATAAGTDRALRWVARRTEADADTLWVIEGIASYGALLAGTVSAHGFPIAEAARMDARRRHGVGKSDALDAHQIAAATLGLPVEKLRRPRLGEGVRQGVRILVTARRAMSKDRTRSINALNGLVRSNALGIDARKALTGFQIAEIARWRSRREELSVAIARAEAVRLARHTQNLEDQLKGNEQQLTELVQVSEAAPLLHETGFGAISAAKCLAACSHQGRVRNEAAFASLAGVNPVPASSGNTVRHRLNRGGDRMLNSALHLVSTTKMTYDAQTREYVAKRRAEGRTDREIRRCIKRYLARHVYRTLNASTPTLNAA